MSYYESAKGEKISLKRVELECKRHGIKLIGVELEDFNRMVQSDADGMYSAQAVLRWLGY